MPYNPLDWYWIIGGTGPHIDEPGGDYTGDETRRFSSARNQYVPADDPGHAAWRDAEMAMNGGIDPTTRIDTEDNLTAVLAPYGIVTPWSPAAPDASAVESNLGGYNARANTTSAANPGNGNLAWNTAAQADATEIYVAATGADGIDYATAWRHSRGRILGIQRKQDSTVTATYTVNSFTDNGAWFLLSVTPASATGLPFANNAELILAFMNP